MPFDFSDLSEPFEFSPRRHGDARGFFVESFRAEWFAGTSAETRFVQENHVRSNRSSVIRGMHSQTGTFTQAKLVRALAGKILDVAVDIRAGSPNIARPRYFEISADSGNQLFVPHGFLHGYFTLTETTEILYKVDNYYNPESEISVRWDDPQLGIEWPLDMATPELSEKDSNAPLFGETPELFRYRRDSTPFKVEYLPSRGLVR